MANGSQNMVSDKARQAFYLQAPHEAGGHTDQYGNLLHNRGVDENNATATGDYWNIKRFDGTAVVRVYWETGEIDGIGTHSITLPNGSQGEFYAIRGNVGVWMGIGSGNVNHGLYSDVKGDWMIYADSNGNVQVNGNAATATTWQYARTFTIGATGKSVKGDADVSWSMTEIMGSSDSTKFYRGDKTWSNVLGGAFQANGTITANGGYLKSTLNSNTVQIGSQNTSFCHITNSANIPFWFNKTIQVDGNVVLYQQNTSLEPGYLHLGKATETGMSASSSNPRICFSEGASTQPVYLMYTDHDAYRAPAGLKVIGGASAAPAWFEVEGSLYLGAPGATGTGIYWNPYVESTTDASDAGSIYQIKAGVAGGTELRINQQNDAADCINLCTNSYIYLNSKRAFTISDSWLRINEDKGFSSGIYTGSSLIRSDNQLQVGSGGTNFYANSSGNGYFSGNMYVGKNLGIAQTGGASGYGLSLYGGAGYALNYGILFAVTSYLGTAWGVTSDWATYLTMDGAKTRGWIFRHADGTKAASINCNGVLGCNQIIMNTTTSSASTSQPTALSYGRLQAYGTLCINADTDGSQTEYVILTSGRGVSSSTSDGLWIGYNTAGFAPGTFSVPNGLICNHGVNFMVGGNEVNFIPDGYNNSFWFNYETFNRQGNGNVTQYIFGNGKHGSLASISSGQFSGNAATATKATQDADGNDIRQKYVNVYNTANIGSSDSVTFTNLAAAGNAVGMIYAATDNPRGGAGWVHCISLCWGKGSSANWISQIAMSTTDGTGLWYRTTSGNIAGKAWTRVLDASNYTSYTVTKTGSGASGTWGISISGNAATASKITNITSSDAASSTGTQRYVFISYDDRTTGRPAYTSALTFQTSTSKLYVGGSIAVSQNNATGGGIVLADDGDIVDMNDGYCSMRFSYGVAITSGKSGGSQVLRLHANGNIYTSNGTRIGESGGALYLGNSGNQNWVYVQDMASQDGSKWKLHQNGAAEFTDIVRCYRLWASQGSNGERCVGVDSATSGNLYFYANPNGKGIYCDSGYQTGAVLTINSSGRFFYGTKFISHVGAGVLQSSDGHFLQVQNDNNLVFYGPSSNVVWSSGTASSRRVKNNIVPVTDSELINFNKLNVISFTYKPEMKMEDTDKQYGLIAEEVMRLYPNLVRIPKDYSDKNFDLTKGWEQPLITLKYEGFIPLLIKMVQKQQKEIEYLKSQIQK